MYDQGVPTNTSNYTVLINNIAAANPDAVVELGYTGNDIAFLRNVQDAGAKFRFLFAIYPGLETEELLKNVGADGLLGVFTYVTAASIEYKPEVGMSLPDFKAAWDKAYPNAGVHFGYNSVAGYTTGLVIEQALAHADSLDQLAIHKAVFDLSGKLKTLDGTFELGRDRSADRRTHATRPGRFRWKGRHQAERGLSAGRTERATADAGQTVGPYP